jgi:DnaD/phage-associated family protein
MSQMLANVSYAPVEDRPQVTLPEPLLLRALNACSDLDELQVVVLVGILTRSGRPIAEPAFVSHPTVEDTYAIVGAPVPGNERAAEALERAVAHGLLIRFLTEDESGSRAWVLLNTTGNARYLAALAEPGRVVPEELWVSQSPPRIVIDRPSVFRLYEQNIGPLTPLVADQLIKALEIYPAQWVESAISEAVSYNRRSWRYISRILENWLAEGPGGGSTGR